MSTAYSQAELLAIMEASINRRPPEMTTDQFYHANRITSFAIFGDNRGVTIRVRTEEKTIRNFALNPEVAIYLARAIAGVAKTAAWTIKDEPLHPQAVSLGLKNPNPKAEARWASEMKRDRVVRPDKDAFDKSPKVVATNGHGSLDEFAVSFALATGTTVHLRINPLVAWELSCSIATVGEAEVWLDEGDGLIPGKDLN